MQNNISRIHGQGVAKIIAGIIYLSFSWFETKIPPKIIIVSITFISPPSFKCFPCGPFFTFSLASFSLTLTYVACLLPYKVIIV